MSHTKEPWEYEQNMRGDGAPIIGYHIYGGEGDETGFVADILTKDDARRIVAAVNACAGIETETLEAAPPGHAEEWFRAWCESTKVEARAEKTQQVLADCHEYFEARADADQPTGSTPIPNEEMRLQMAIEEISDV